MRIVHRIVTLAALGAFGIALSACTDFDPDKLDVFHLNEKKKLPGERKELFPGGVPGVTQGIPQEYMKGNEPPPETAQAPTPEQPKPAAEAATEKEKKTAAVEAEPEPKPKPKAKRKPKPHPAANPAQQPQQASGQTQPPAWPQDQQAAPQQAQSPWPAQQGQASTAAPWPSAPAPGTFSR